MLRIYWYKNEYSETVKDRGLVPKDHQSEMANGETNGHLTDVKG